LVALCPAPYTLGQHAGSITDLGSEVDSYRGAAPTGAEAPRPILVSADDAGLVNVWAANTPTDFAKLFGVQLKAPVATVAARGDQVIVAEVGVTDGRNPKFGFQQNQSHLSLRSQFPLV